jgi:hypothetical protein
MKLRWARRQIANLRKVFGTRRRVDKRDDEITGDPQAIRQLMAPAEKLRRGGGFHVRENAVHSRRWKARHVIE